MFHRSVHIQILIVCKPLIFIQFSAIYATATDGITTVYSMSTMDKTGVIFPYAHCVSSPTTFCTSKYFIIASMDIARVFCTETNTLLATLRHGFFCPTAITAVEITNNDLLVLIANERGDVRCGRYFRSTGIVVDLANPETFVTEFQGVCRDCVRGITANYDSHTQVVSAVIFPVRGTAEICNVHIDKGFFSDRLLFRVATRDLWDAILVRSPSKKELEEGKCAIPSVAVSGGGDVILCAQDSSLRYHTSYIHTSVMRAAETAFDLDVWNVNTESKNGDLLVVSNASRLVFMKSQELLDRETEEKAAKAKAAKDAEMAALLAKKEAEEEKQRKLEQENPNEQRGSDLDDTYTDQNNKINSNNQNEIEGDVNMDENETGNLEENKNHIDEDTESADEDFLFGNSAAPVVATKVDEVEDQARNTAAEKSAEGIDNLFGDGAN